MKNLIIENRSEFLNEEQLDNIIYNMGFTNPMEIAKYLKYTYEYQRKKDKKAMKHMVETINEFFTLMDDIETSDNGIETKTFSLSCSVTSMCIKMENVLSKMKEISKIDMEKTAYIKIDDNE
jgi:hypothetical protein